MQMLTSTSRQIQCMEAAHATGVNMSTGKESGIGLVSGVCIVVNLLMGSGYLAMPNGFYEGGLIASSAVLLGVLGVMIVTCTWESKCVVKAARVLNSSKIPEVAEAMRVYCGNYWRNAYITVLALSLGTSSWVFAVLFAQTTSASVPYYHPEVICQSGVVGDASVCETRYLLNILVFGMITTPLALLDVKEQAVIQNALAVMRVLRCALMICTPLLASSQEELERGFPYITSETMVQTPLVARDVDGVLIILSVCVFSFFLNSSVPIFIDALRDVSQALRILLYGFLITAGLYWVFAVVGSMKFGSAISSTCNLAWNGFRWPFMKECAEGSMCALTSTAVEYLVVFSPVLDVISVYPLGTIVLANSVWEVIFGVPHHEFPGAVDQLLVNHYVPVAFSGSATAAATETTRLIKTIDSEQTVEKTWMGMSWEGFMKKSIRFVLNILPLVAAALMQNFLQIVSFAGSISVLICLVFPAFLSLRCSSYEEEHGVAARTVTAENHLYWCDRPLHLLFPQRYRTKRLGGGDSDRAEVVLDHDDPETSFLEQRWFKLLVLWMGVGITGVVFYSSLVPVPKY